MPKLGVDIIEIHRHRPRLDHQHRETLVGTRFINSSRQSIHCSRQPSTRPLLLGDD
jgi:hypothetical protein